MKVKIVSVHVNSPVLTAIQAKCLRGQVGVDMSFTVFDNGGDLFSKKVYWELLNGGHVDEVISTGIGDSSEHGLALDFFFEQANWDQYDQFIIMDSDCFFTESDDLKILSDEIESQGISGAVYPPLFYPYKIPIFHVSLFGVKSHILKYAIAKRKTFTIQSQMPPDIQERIPGGKFMDTGTLIGYELSGLTPQCTRCKFSHVWGVTCAFFDQLNHGVRRYIWRGPHARLKFNALHYMYTKWKCEPLFESLKIKFPSGIIDCVDGKNPWNGIS